MSNLTILISLTLGILAFMFLIWRRLKEDYPPDRVFTLGFIFSFCLAVGTLIGVYFQSRILQSGIFNPSGLWFWFSFLALSAGFVVSFYKYKFRFFETLETLGQAFLFWLLVIFVVQAIVSLNLALLIFSLFICFLIYLFNFLNKSYKNFSWYKSGKVGFSGLSVLCLFFVVRIVVAIFAPNMLTFVGKFDAIIDVASVFVFFVILFNLSDI